MGSPAGTVLEENLDFVMVDFFKEHKYLIKLGLASSPKDVNTMKFYQITAQDRKVIKPKNSLRFQNARVICDGKLQNLGCDGVVAVTHPLQPSPEGDFILKMGGPLDALSKSNVVCTCGTAFMVYADASVGEKDVCYLTVVTLSQPESAKFEITPFFETDAVDVISG